MQEAYSAQAINIKKHMNLPRRPNRPVKRVDKTNLFQALEHEIFNSGSRAQNLAEELARSKSELLEFFENPDMLETSLNVGGLIYEAGFLRSKAGKPWIRELVRTFLNEARAARDKNSSALFESFSVWAIPNDLAVRNAAGVNTLMLHRRDDDELEPEYFVKSLFREIGDYLEGSVQPFIRLRLHLLELGHQRSETKLIDLLTFGELVSELRRLGRSTAYEQGPGQVPINQWRNIANHNSYKVEGEEVLCTYGPSDRRKEVRITLEETISLLQYVADLYYAHKTAVEFFATDNIERMSYEGVTISQYTADSQLAHGIVAAGFSVLEASLDEAGWKLHLRDRLDRGKTAIKEILQDSCFSYVLTAQSCRFDVIVNSKGNTYRFGWLSRIVKRDLIVQKPGEIVRTLDTKWRVFKPDENTR